jgi:putative hemolysin
LLQHPGIGLSEFPVEIAILLVLFLLNGVFAMSEMSVVSSRKPRLMQWADERRPGAADALALSNDPGNFLSTIQIGITVIGVLSGAFGEATVSSKLAACLAQWQAIAPYAEQAALVVVVVGITFCSLIIGELVPKRLALRNPEAIASRIARPMRVFTAATYPVVRFLGWVTEGILKALGARTAQQPPITEEEIRVLMSQGTAAGIFEPHEQRMVSRVFRMDDEHVTAVMTPRMDVVYLDLQDSFEENRKRILDNDHTRFPVCDGGIDNILGVVHTRALLEDLLQDRPVRLREHIQPPLYVPGSVSVTDLLETFSRDRADLALVLDEYGELEGLITIDDIMEALVGGLGAVGTTADSDITQREDGSWLVDGTTTVHRFREIVDLTEELPGEDAGMYHTLGGFMMAELERVPRAGDKVHLAGHTFEVLDMDRNRVDKILVTPDAGAAEIQRPE